MPELRQALLDTIKARGDVEAAADALAMAKPARSAGRSQQLEVRQWPMHPTRVIILVIILIRVGYLYTILFMLNVTLGRIGGGPLKDASSCSDLLPPLYPTPYPNSEVH